MKTKYSKISLLLFAALLIHACTAFEDAADVKKIEYITINLKTNFEIQGLENFSNLKVTLNNYDEGIVIEKPFARDLSIGNLIPGIYDILISGRAEDVFGESFLMSGSLEKKALLADGENILILADGVNVKPLIFKEIYYCGSKTPSNTNWFRDQFYEIYNNSLDVIYLDGLYFANLYPIAATATLPIWPETDGNKYVYADRIWKVPGNGTDYPLAPGESFVISQFAANQQLDIYNPKSPVNCYSSEFEFNMNNANFPNQPAYDMLHVFYNGKADMTGVQYLTSVFGGAYVIFRVPEGEIYDPENNPELQTKNLASGSTIYGKIPVAYVLDGVEAVDNDAKAQYKRMPALLDQGVTTVGDTYIGQSVARKRIGQNPDGTPVLQDTNNSTEDFDRNLIPQFRRYDSKMPGWNHTLSGN
ncbi:MAG: DUF4876 domain-containing protein [Dysgonamonadaceae bacterium]|jgi:hypothetical protein|nr:DUF4876 domain-containing protein [Dysgonamonadaceae bacterium]